MYVYNLSCRYVDYFLPSLVTKRRNKILGRVEAPHLQPGASCSSDTTGLQIFYSHFVEQPSKVLRRIAKNVVRQELPSPASPPPPRRL